MIKCCLSYSIVSVLLQAVDAVGAQTTMHHPTWILNLLFLQVFPNMMDVVIGMANFCCNTFFKVHMICKTSQCKCRHKKW